MNRRQYLHALGVSATGALAGCAGLFETGRESTGEPPLVENRPDAVYVPTHVEGMEMIGMHSVGRLRLALSYSYPHRFWLLDGDEPNRQDIGDSSIHLMASVWDAETGRTIPSSNASATITTASGEPVEDRALWPMLSQNMGFHYGDNVSLDGDGTYEVQLTFGPVGTRRTGTFAGEFDDLIETTATFEFSQSDLEEIRYTLLEDRQGQRGAVEPMQMEMMPIPQLPQAQALPGTLLGEGSSGDGQFVVSLQSEPPASVEGNQSYLGVSARTPYNRFPLPFTSLSVRLARDGTSLFDGPLQATLDPNLGYHYGTGVEDVREGDELTISVGAPPQVARHEGYETAFLAMDPVELTVGGNGGG